MRKKGQKRVFKAGKTSEKGREKAVSPKEHVRKISYDYKKRAGKFEPAKKEKPIKRPLGIRVLIAYLSLLLGLYFFYLFLGIKSPIAVAFGQVIGGLPALLLIMFLITVNIFLIAGLVKRKKWSYYLALAVFSFGIANSLISLILLRPEVASFTRSFLILSSVTVFVIDILAILYIVSEKRYFFASQFLEKKTRVVDKVFVSALIIFLIITVSIGSAIGYDFYRTNIEQTARIISELEGATYAEQVGICSSMDSQQKDLCLLIVSIKTGEKSLCEQMESDFYRFSCLQA